MMIRTLLISMTLVGASAAGAIALASLHSATGPKVARLAEPEVRVVPQSGDRFVTPSFVPAPTLARVSPDALPGMPDVENDAPLILTPFATTVDPAVPAPSVGDSLIPPKPVVASRSAPKRTVAPKKKVRTQKFARVEPRVLPQKQSNRAKMRPVIVAQTPSFLSSQSVSTPDYVIGVYR